MRRKGALQREGALYKYITVLVGIYLLIGFEIAIESRLLLPGFLEILNTCTVKMVLYSNTHGISDSKHKVCKSVHPVR